MFRPLRFIAMALLCGIAFAAIAQAAPGPLEDEPPALQLEERPEPFRPRRPRAQHELDRLHAAALYAAGCSKQQQGDKPGALRDFQRAWRYDPTAQSILRDVIALADQLRRDGVSNRYAMKLDVARISDVRQLHRLGLLLYVSGKHAESANAFTVVLKALESPERSGLSRADTALILRNAAQTYRLYGESFLEAGRLDEAKSRFHQSQSGPSQPVVARSQHGAD